MPMNMNFWKGIPGEFKVEMVLDLAKEEDSCWNYLWEFSTYHNRWNDLKQEDFESKVEYEKGAKSCTEVATPGKVRNFKTIEAYSGEELPGMVYLRKIIEYCKENNIQVLVTHLPYPASIDRIANSKYVSKICDEYEVDEVTARQDCANLLNQWIEVGFIEE